jgi:dTDP-4-dehydrorhamnose 3,5-epimerase
MIFTPTPSSGAYLIDLQKKGDDRGFFARTFCENEFRQNDLVGHFCQINNSLSGPKGMLRGMHYRLAPRAETKVVRCIRGAVYDLILDLRVDSPTFSLSFGAELTAENRRMNSTETIYLVDEFYSPEYERVIRYNDPRFKLHWPAAPVLISAKDKSQPDFDPAWHLAS